MDALGGLNLTDPNRHVPFPLVRPDRVLTGADLDVESIARVRDGSYWIGDEFGPYLLHFDRAGFPFTTIENVVILDDRTLGVLNDNNFPFSSGRTPGEADNNEFITIRLAGKL